MGNEAHCTATVRGRAVAGKALLETAELRFREDGPLRLALPLAELARVEAKDGVLVVVHRGERYGFELGAQAARWAEKILRPKGRLEKLGVKPGLLVALVGGHEDGFAGELAKAGATLASPRAKGVDALFLAAEGRAALAKLPAAKARLAPAGALWVIRPKGVATITEAEVRKAALDAGLVDVKVVSFSATHTAEKLVIPVAARPKPAAKRRA